MSVSLIAADSECGQGPAGAPGPGARVAIVDRATAYFSVRTGWPAGRHWRGFEVRRGTARRRT